MWEVRARLEVLVVGDETESQVDETIEAAISRPLLEWTKHVEQCESAERQRVLDKCLTVALPVMEAAVPWIQDVVVDYICTTLGMPPSPSSSASEADAPSTNGAASESPESPTPRPEPQRPVHPSSPPMDCGEAAASESVSSMSSDTRMAVS